MLLYAVAKFVAYAVWWFFGLYLFAARPSLVGALKFGAVRWLLGLAFGLLAAVGLGSVSAQSVSALYVGVYVPLRVIEWSIMVRLAAGGEPAPRTLIRNPKTWVWVLGGIAVSFASDLASPEGMAGRFCVGRCLC
jgi:hypothetical protein